MSRCFGIFLFLWLVSGCAGHSIQVPDSLTSSVRTYKSFRLPAGAAGMKPTGVVLERGEMVTLMATGSIDYCPKGGCKWRRVQPEMGWPLMARVGEDGLYFAPLSMRTSASTQKMFQAEGGGELFVGYRQGPVNSKGEPLHPRYYEWDAGAFYLNIIVWKTEDWTRIADALEKMQARNPDYEPLQVAAEDAGFYRDLARTRAQAEQELAETKKKIEKIQEKSPAPPRVEKPAETAPPPPAGQKNVAELQSKVAELTALLAKLSETQAALEEEQKKSQKLAAEIDAFEEREQELLSRLGKSGGKPPVVVVAEPTDGLQTEARQVTLALVAEDDAGIDRVEITVNGRPISEGEVRGVTVAGQAARRRIELRRSVMLTDGENRIAVRAVDTDGAEVVREVVLERIERRRNLWAVVVGINAYRNVRPLSYAVEDARAFYRFLTVQDRVPAENVILLLDKDATLNRLRSVLGTQIKSRAGAQDMVVVFFAGHGAAEKDAFSPDGDGLEKYLLPVDADPEDLYASALPMREVSHIFRRIRAERLVFIVDACYSGASGGRTIELPGIRAQISDAFLDRLCTGKGRVILSASGANEVSAEKPEFGHGVFTYYLLQALEGAADSDQDGQVTVDEVYRYVSARVPKATGQEQHPVRKGAVEGQIVLGIVP
jgi:hypothetical protein